ncbi:hypothetical protein TNCV_1522001 [Trichonephila clavipes]|nr:hypothetical protein TNCV_1522001 [Trichonephila clavipes]
MIVQFRNEKISNHGSIPITIDCNVVAFIVFEEVRTNDSTSPLSVPNNSHFSIRACRINKWFGLEWNQAEKYEANHIVAQIEQHVQKRVCQCGELPLTARGLLVTDLVILNHGQVTSTAPELEPPLLTSTPHQREDV